MSCYEHDQIFLWDCIKIQTDFVLNKMLYYKVNVVLNLYAFQAGIFVSIPRNLTVFFLYIEIVSVKNPVEKRRAEVLLHTLL